MEQNKATIEMTGWLNNVSDFNWGRSVTVGIDVRRPNDSGTWETVDKTIYDVTIEDKSWEYAGIKQVKVVGKITGTGSFQKRDGTTGVSIKVKAESVVPLTVEKVSEAAIMEQWPTAKIGQGKFVDDEAPF